MTIQEIFTSLKSKCDESRIIIAAVNKPYYLADEQQRTIRDFVVRQAFINVVTEWEHFLENTTIAYSLSEPSIKGNCPKKFVSPIDAEHSNKIITGATQYFDWTDMDKVLNLEEVFFEKGLPYTTALNGFSSKYKNIKKIRNYIVHNSKKSRDEFDALVRTELSPSRVGITPAEFLLSKKDSNPFFYLVYTQHIENAAQLIAEY